MSPKTHKFQFYLDENFPVFAGKFLQLKGHNVKFAISIKIARGKTDIWQLKHCIKENRILLGLDQDFKHFQNLLDLITKCPGVILLKSSDLSGKKLIQILKMVLKGISQNKISGKICIASITKINYVDPSKLSKNNLLNKF